MIAPYGAVQITIQFTSFSTQPTNDVVRVFQCSDVYCSQQQQLAELSGTYPGVQTITSMSGYMRVVFTSDESVNYDGFTASWSSVSIFFAKLACHLGWRTFLKCNKTNHACLPLKLDARLF
jgi:hypothetical protein